MIQITLSEYRDLKEDSWLLQELHDAGVDNWEWYGEAYMRYIDRKDAENNQND